jgi:hypothetical protein
MIVSPIHPDPRIVATFVPLFIAAAALAIGLALRSVIDHSSTKAIRGAS